MWWIKSLVLSNEIFHAGILIRALPSLTPLWKTKQQQEQQCPVCSWNQTVWVTLSNLWQFRAVFSFTLFWPEHFVACWLFCCCCCCFFVVFFSSFVLLHGTLINPIFSADKSYVGVGGWGGSPPLKLCRSSLMPRRNDVLSMHVPRHLITFWVRVDWLTCSQVNGVCLHSYLLIA